MASPSASSEARRAAIVERAMTPERLKQLNLQHFDRLLERTTDPEERARIEGLIAEEKAKVEAAYPDRDKLRLKP